ncbi:acyl-CoA dehydrogenase family protein [Methylopila sp. M107]|uniref:acyl-CoA dehydrogenase family protein n=1 Tax=Methylopila sp. M107 TaxID=1101190 RepID=UPI00059031D1|nr:acyl-CoA dehydrogenase family protein [Methylopila sp. M107]
MNRPVLRMEIVDALARRFAESAAAHDREARFPFENFAALAEAGLLALVAPSRHGGAGAGLAEAAAVVGRIARAEPSTALVLSMQYLQHALWTGWPDATVARLTREAATGVSLINMLRVEPDLGTPSRGGLPATIARRTDTGWVLSGHKIYTTGAPVLSWFAVFARTDEEPARVGTFLAPRGAAGLRIEETWDSLGMRASGSHDVHFDDVALGQDAAVDLRRPEDVGPNPVLQAWNAALLGALYTGVAQAAADWLARFLQERVPSNLGASLATLTRFQEIAGGIEERLAVNGRLIRSLAADVDGGRPPSPEEGALLKAALTDNAIAAVEAAVAAAGNPALARKNPLERHLRDVLAARIHTPQADLSRATAGRAAIARRASGE